MAKYIMRLDDASDYMDIERWDRMKQLLDKYDVKPIFGIIPDNKDEALIGIYERDEKFWEKMQDWICAGWTPALHGYEHRYVTADGGCNPLFDRSEFAGLSFDEQCRKIENGYKILTGHGIIPEIFFAPSHTFDKNTLNALKEKTPIRIISDTIANDVYKDGDFCFIPQQSGRVRKLPFKTVTFCYHPNIMKDEEYDILEQFLMEHRDEFVKFEKKILKNRRFGVLDKLLRWIYFSRRK